jgi:hypothetical protein
MTNILYMVHQYRLPYTKADSASLDFLCKVVENRHYLNRAPVVSPSYNRSPVLLYHLSRLMARDSILQLEKWKPQLVEDALRLYQNSDNFLDRILLSTALMRWKVQLPVDVFVTDKTMKDFVEQDDDFVFFIASITSMLPNPLNRILRKTNIGKFNYYSPAYNYALVVENMVVKKLMSK